MSSDSSSSDSNSDEENYPKSMLEWEDKWWLTKRHSNLENPKDDSVVGYICTIFDHGNLYDDAQIETRHFKKISNAYNYVCDYLTEKYNTFGGDSLNLYNVAHNHFPEYEDSLSDWKNVYFLLNYGGSSGATPYTITVSPIPFEDE